jgi:Na+/proline symporter
MSGLRAIDFVIIVGYLLAITAFGISFRKGQQSLKD